MDFFNAERMPRITKEFAVVILRVLLVSGASFLLIPILTKTMGATAFGTWAQYKSALRMLLPVVTLNLSYGMIRYIPSSATERRMNDLLSTGILVFSGSTAGAFAVFLNRGWIAETFLAGQETVVLVFSATLPTVAVMTLLLNFLRAERRVVTHALVTGMLHLLVPAGFLTLALTTQSLATCLIYYLLLHLFAVFVLLPLVFRFPSIGFPDFGHLKNLLRFSLPLLAVAVQVAVVESSDRFMIAAYLGLDATGSYATGYQIGAGIQLFLTPFTFLLPTIISKRWDDGRYDEVNRILGDCATVFVGAAVVAALVFASYADHLLGWLTTKDIAASASSILVLSACSYIFYGLFVIASQFLYASKKTGLSAMFWTTSMIVNIVLNLLLIPELGITGAALATVAAHVVLTASFSAVLSGVAQEILRPQLWRLLSLGAILIFGCYMFGQQPRPIGFSLATTSVSIGLWLFSFRVVCGGTFLRLKNLARGIV